MESSLGIRQGTEIIVTADRADSAAAIADSAARGRATIQVIP